MTSDRESIVDAFGMKFKAVEWNPHYHGNGVDNPWLDEAPIRQKYWTSLAPGQVVIDIGACFGLYTLSALAQGATVLAFEPNREFLGFISESVSMNEGFGDRYKGYDHVVWNDTQFPPEMNGLLVEWCKTTSFTMTTLDDITKDMECVDVIKIDVEGAELGVLEGAKETIRKHKPKFLIEDHHGLYDYCAKNNTSNGVLAILKSHGYSLSRELFGGPPPPGGGRYFIIANPPSDDKVIGMVQSKPMISVIVPTNRVGGLDVLFESLKAQTFQNFELVLVDALYKYRKNVVAEKSKLYNFPVKHIEPEPNIFPVVNYCKLVNTGLCAAEGSIAYFTCDHSHMPKDNLMTHAVFHSLTPRNYILLLAVNDCPVRLDAVSDNFPKHRQYGTRGRDSEVQLLVVPEEVYVSRHNEWSDRYVEDLDAGLLDKVLWSLFETPFTYGPLDDYIVVNNLDKKFDAYSATEATPAFHDLCCMKNDSFKLDFLLEANGLEEEMDGTHGFQDSELARRLTRVHGGIFFAMNTMQNSVINTRYYLEPRKIVKGYNNHNIIVQKNNKEQALTNNTITEWKKRK
jgi:FkbM family methyltransferase